MSYTKHPWYVDEVVRILASGPKTIAELEEALPDLDLNDHIHHALTLLERDGTVGNRRSPRHLMHYEYGLLHNAVVKAVTTVLKEKGPFMVAPKTGPVKKTPALTQSGPVKKTGPVRKTPAP